MTRTSHRPPRAAGRAGRTNLFRFAVPLHPTTAHFHLQPQHRSTFSHFNIFTFSHFPYIRGTVKLGVRAPRESTSGTHFHSFLKNFVHSENRLHQLCIKHRTGSLDSADSATARPPWFFSGLRLRSSVRSSPAAFARRPSSSTCTSTERGFRTKIPSNIVKAHINPLLMP